MSEPPLSDEQVAKRIAKARRYRNVVGRGKGRTVEIARRERLAIDWGQRYFNYCERHPESDAMTRKLLDAFMANPHVCSGVTANEFDEE